MSKHEARITNTSQGFYALIVRIDRDGSESVIHGYNGRHYATEAAAQRNTARYIAKITKPETYWSRTLGRNVTVPS